MDLSKITIKLNEVSNLKTENLEINKQTISQQNIDLKSATENDSVLKENSLIEATVIKKIEDGLFLLKLSNGKNLKLETNQELKPLDSLSLKIDNAKVVDFQIKDIVSSIKLPATEFINIISQIVTETNQQESKILEKLSLVKLPQDPNLKIITTDTSDKLPESQQIKTTNDIFESIEKKSQLELTNHDKKIIEKILQQDNLINLKDNKVIKLDSLNDIKQITFTDKAIKNFIPLLTNDNIDVKVLENINHNTVKVALNKNLEFNLTFAKPELITKKFIELKTTDVQTLSYNNNTVKQVIINNIKPELELNFFKLEQKQSQFIELTAKTQNISKENILILPQIDNLKLKLPTEIVDNANSNDYLKIKIDLVNKQLYLQDASLKTETKITNLDIVDNQKINQLMPTVLNSYTPSSANNEQVVFKSLDNLFEIVLQVKNNIQDLKNIKVDFNNNQQLYLQYPEKTSYTEINNAINEISNLTKQAIPNTEKNFIPHLFKLFNNILQQSNNSSNQITPEQEILNLFNDLIPDEHKPQLHNLTGQNDNIWRYFSFPYIQQDELYQGQILYNKNSKEQSEKATNIAFKVNFSQIGDIMLKMSILNKNINMSIESNYSFSNNEKDQLLQIANNSLKNSGFLGTVNFKKVNKVNFPLLKNNNLGYNSLNIEV